MLILYATASNESINSATIYWSIDNALTFNKVEMTDLSSGNFQGGIPAQQSGTKVQYFVYVKSNSTNYSFTEVYSFNVGNDNQAPTIALLNPYFNSTVNAFGPSPYEFSVLTDDNMGIDTSSAKLIYWVNNDNLDSTALVFQGENKFKGTFTFSNALQVGDRVNYYFEVNDISSNKNAGSSDTLFYLIDTLQIIDDFENGASLWDLGNGWGITKAYKNGGVFSITDSPFGNYVDNSDNALTFRYPFNLSIYKYAELNFFIRHFLENGKDSILIEISNDGGAKWNLVEAYTGVAFSFRNKKIKISEYTGAGNENMQFRFRVVSDGAVNQDGVHIDDINIKVSSNPILTDLESDQISGPTSFSLSQNYPNPFNPSTTIEFALPVAAKIKVKVYDLLGQIVKVIFDGIKDAGYHQLNWNSDYASSGSVSSGVYFYELNAVGVDGREFNQMKKMILIK